MPYALIPSLLIVAGLCGLCTSFDMMRDTDGHTRFVGVVMLVCSLIMGSFGTLILLA
jgi:hypothetical protein